ncbi:4-hydroxy-3-methylbut-2-en-1-yl diphosphate synthase [Novimethylophilus kurashikiensis]|uniref:4-hydroxy-3-methylbut-2-en-1-yl diphosphate synthase n=1 Tax=Novimethylophilus kurashikiensis TaxID=1825523 RepID=A0A2R5F9H1_9PROT|nr:NUDIX domain-containing protein [Novimethylophilus kurashikiensis]GBG14847.1 4-hydroxy-3-methylbut-2-en-1-yl diphosphate synthase [Novimethylophilus kurashikiensis]
MNVFEYPLPVTTVDAALLTLRGERLHVALHRRENIPEQGKLALPGGVIHIDEDVDTDAAVLRVLQQKTGFIPRYIEQLRVFSGKRDNRWDWSVSVAYIALVPLADLEAAGKGVFHFYDVDDLPVDLAFDHRRIIAAAVERVRNKSAYSTLPCALLPEQFTLTQLQKTYEAVLQVKLDKANFRRRIDAMGCVIPTGEFQSGMQRPAKFYRFENVMVFNKAL